MSVVCHRRRKHIRMGRLANTGSHPTDAKGACVLRIPQSFVKSPGSAFVIRGSWRNHFLFILGLSLCGVSLVLFTAPSPKAPPFEQLQSRCPQSPGRVDKWTCKVCASIRAPQLTSGVFLHFLHSSFTEAGALARLRA